jgi:hypothetical protein
MKSLAAPEQTYALLVRLGQVHADSERRWGRMDAHQMICHLADACRMALGDKPVRDVSSVATRTLIKWMALYQPQPWPPGLVTRPEIDQTAGGTAPTTFAGDVEILRGLVRRLGNAPRDFAWPIHPVFGRLSWAQWMRWGYLHTDHHLRQFGA